MDETANCYKSTDMSTHTHTHTHIISQEIAPYIGCRKRKDVACEKLLQLPQHLTLSHHYQWIWLHTLPKGRDTLGGVLWDSWLFYWFFYSEIQFEFRTPPQPGSIIKCLHNLTFKFICITPHFSPPLSLCPLPFPTAHNVLISKFLMSL